MLKCYYAYVDKSDEIGRTVVSRFGYFKVIHALTTKDKEGDSFTILVVSFPKKKEAKFLEAREHHQRCASLFGWEKEKSFIEAVKDMHSAAETTR